MLRDCRAYLWDVRDSAEAISEFIKGRTLNDYRSDRMLRSAVERQFEIIGEALNQLAKIAPEIAQDIPELAQAVAFRNLLIHGYAKVVDAMVWQTARDDLPALHERVSSILLRLDEESLCIDGVESAKLND